MKKVIKIIALVLIVVVVGSFFKDVLIKSAVESGVKIVTGLKLSISSFRVGLINTMVGIKNLKLYNPAGFKDRVMLDMPEIYVDYNLGAIMKGKIHLEDLKINMNEFVVVKNEKGELNLDSLKVVQSSKKKEAPKTSGKAAKIPEIQIDSMELKIGRVIYKDYSKGGDKPVVQE